MRQVDEITDRPARTLAAPTGLRSPTGAVPLTLPSAIPPPADAAPVVPFLPAIAPKPPAPVTGQVAATLLAAQLSGTPGSPTTSARPKKRRHTFLIVVGVLVTVTLALAVVFRNSALVQRFTGKGYDSNPLPTQAFPMPAFTGAEYTFTVQSVSMKDGLPTNYWRTERDEVNYTSNTAKLTTDLAKASIIGGSIGKPQTVTAPYDVYVDQQSSYEAGATATDPWTRTPLQPGTFLQDIFTRGEINMYQDVFDPALRSQQPTSVISEQRHDVPVTTYTYTFAFGDLYESAPRLFDMMRMLDGNAADDAKATVTISLDQQMMVRYLDVDVDYDSVLERRAKKDVENFYPYRYTVEIVSTSDAPPVVAVPTNVVDVTTTTTPTTLPDPAVTP